MPRIGWGLLSPSPFCLKLEILLRMRGDAYELRPTIGTSKAPLGKLPWIEHAGTRIADSGVIAAWLQQRSDVLDEASVPDTVRARAHLVRRTTEESLYFALVAERWRDPAIRTRYANDLLVDVPRPLRFPVASIATKMLYRQLWQQGYGRHTLDHVRELARADLSALACSLGDQPYFTGERPRAIDASVFGLLANIWYVPVDGPLRRTLAQHQALTAYLERIRSAFAAEVRAVVPA